MKTVFYLTISSAVLSSLGNNYLGFLPINGTYIFGGLFFLLFYVLSKKGIGTVFSFLTKVVIVQSIIMGIVSSFFDTNYLTLKLISLGLSTVIVVLGFNKLKELTEQGILIPLGLFKKKYDTKFFNIKKDNANLNLSIEEIDSLGNNGRDFEEFIAKLYRACGFISKTTTELRNENDLPETIMSRGGSGEQGADVLVFFDEPKTINGYSVDGFIIQCKQYSSKVENKAVQEVVGAIKMYEKHFMKKLHPLVITNNYLTGPAMDLAKANGVSYIDRDSIQDLIDLAVKSLDETKNTLVA